MSKRHLVGLMLALVILVAPACSAATPRVAPTPTLTLTKPAYTPKAAVPTGAVSLPAGGASRLEVGNTGGEGVWIRRTPAMADRLRTWPDKTPMQVVGADKQAEERTWKNVQDPAGNTGWIPAEYLVDPAPTPTPRSSATAQAVASAAACIRPSRVFVEQLTNGLNFPAGGLAGAQAIQLPVASSKEGLYLVAGAILGSARGKEVTGLWATTADPTAEVFSGTLVAANAIAKELTIWPQPAEGLARFPESDPDVQRALRCLEVSLDR